MIMPYLPSFHIYVKFAQFIDKNMICTNVRFGLLNTEQVCQKGRKTRRLSPETQDDLDAAIVINGYLKVNTMNTDGSF